MLDGLRMWQLSLRRFGVCVFVSNGPVFLCGWGPAIPNAGVKVCPVCGLTVVMAMALKSAICAMITKCAAQVCLISAALVALSSNPLSVGSRVELSQLSSPVRVSV
jgi:hypothetical protein